MDKSKRDNRKVDPLSGAEDKEITPPLQTVPANKKADASSAIIPGTGEIVKDSSGRETKRIVRT